MPGKTTFTETEAAALDEKPVGRYLLGLIPGIIGMVCLWVQWPNDAISTRAILTIITAYSMLCYTSSLHETIHQTLFRNNFWNLGLGRYIGAFIFVPYTSYRETHIRHHAYLNTPADWELWPYAWPSCSLAFRRFFVWIDLLFGLFSGAIVYGRIYFHPQTPIRSPEVRRTIRCEYALCAVFWATTLTLLALFGQFGNFARAWLVPAMIAGALQTGRKLTEHLGMSSYDPLLGTRTVVGSSWLTRACSLANFDIFVHGPHHRHPRMPHTQLSAEMQDRIVGSPDVKFPVFPSYYRAVRDMAPHLFRNPGCGMNAGAAAPKSAMSGPADFDSDVLQPEPESAAVR